MQMLLQVKTSFLKSLKSVSFIIRSVHTSIYRTELMSSVYFINYNCFEISTAAWEEKKIFSIIIQQQSKERYEFQCRTNAVNYLLGFI